MSKDSKDKFRYKNEENLDSVFNYLSMLNKGLKHRHLTFGKDDDLVDIRLPDDVMMAIEADTRDDEGSLKIHIRWSAPEVSEEDETGASLQDEECETFDNDDEAARKAEKERLKEEKKRLKAERKAAEKAEKKRLKAEKEAAEAAAKAAKQMRKAEEKAKEEAGKAREAAKPQPRSRAKAKAKPKAKSKTKVKSKARSSRVTS